MIGFLDAVFQENSYGMHGSGIFSGKMAIYKSKQKLRIDGRKSSSVLKLFYNTQLPSWH